MDARESVEEYLGGLETRRRAARRGQWLTLGVGVGVAAVAYLTSIGVASMEARGILASAGVVALGFALRITPTDPGG